MAWPGVQHISPYICGINKVDDGNLLRASTSLRDEAREILYDRTTFRFYMDDTRSDVSSTADISAAKLIQNLELVGSALVDPLGDEQRPAGEIVDSLARSQTPRKSCRVLIADVRSPDHLYHYGTDFFSKHLLFFCSFETLSIEFTPSEQACFSPRIYDCQTCGSDFSEAYEEKFTENFTSFLECSFGSYVKTRLDWGVCFIFHPLASYG